MQYVGKVFSTVSEFYKELNPATLSGAIDIIVAERPDGQLACTPFHVRFGKFQLLRPSEKVVDITVNNQPVEVHMKLGDAGEAFFVVETDHPVPLEYATSPIAEPVDYDDREPDYLDLGGPSSDQAGLETDAWHNEGYVSAASDHDDTDSHGLAPEDQLPHPREYHPYTLPGESDGPAIDPATGSLPLTTSHSQAPHQRHSLDVKRTTKPFPRAGLNIHDDSILLDTTGYKINQPHKQLSPISRNVFETDDRPDFFEKRQRSRTMLAELRHDIKSDDEYATFPEVSTTTSPRTARTIAPGPSGPSTTVAEQPYIPLEFQPDDTRAEQLRGPLSDSELNYTYISTQTSETSWGWRWNLLPNRKVQPQARNQEPRRASDPTSLRAVSDDSSQAENLCTRPHRAWSQSSDQPASRVLPPTTPPRASAPVELSLCGWRNLGYDDAVNAQVFQVHQVQFDHFASDCHALLADQNLVFRVNSKYYTWPNVAPLLVSLLAFHEPVSLPSISELLPAPSAPPTPQVEHPLGHGQASTDKPALGDANDADTEDDSGASTAPTAGTTRRRWRWWGQKTAPHNTSDVPPIPEPSRPGPPHVLQHARSASELVERSPTADIERIVVPSDEPLVSPRHFAKTLRLTSDQLQTLGLKYGVNSIRFTVRSSLARRHTATQMNLDPEAGNDETNPPLGPNDDRLTSAYCSAKIFFLKSDTQLVISDIDGTITRSDALGHLFTMVGKDWTHTGVAKLYTDIARNGYQIMYLTSRAIGQADTTRDYLRRVTQGPYHLPDGPVIMSPDRLFESFHREVIARQPQVFKMACLRDINNVFGDRNPFYAGFGNRITDALSYRSVNIPSSRIFTIDYSGEVRLELLMGYRSSYISLSSLVDQMFPSVDEKIETEYNDWNFWRPSLPTLDDAMATLALKGTDQASHSTTGNQAPSDQPHQDTEPKPALPPDNPIERHVAKRRSTTFARSIRDTLLPASSGSTPSNSPPASTSSKQNRKGVIGRVTNLGGLFESLNRNTMPSKGQDGDAPDHAAEASQQVPVKVVAHLGDDGHGDAKYDTTEGDSQLTMDSASQRASNFNPSDLTAAMDESDASRFAGLEPVSFSAPQQREFPLALDKPPTDTMAAAMDPVVDLDDAQRNSSSSQGTVPPTIDTTKPTDAQQPQAQSRQADQKDMFNEYLDQTQLSPEIDLNEFSYL
ncbi:lipin Ned1 [Dimargaris verticillata]|uniref:phosphatidate phosphatase n=1 Tax=Dimargaris verticillata TaxID=2761393 RepID=A0A9W8BCI8_9FUNG|nr:lipin Ned1 [Dimargaris verticillata]